MDGPLTRSRLGWSRFRCEASPLLSARRYQRDNTIVSVTTRLVTQQSYEQIVGNGSSDIDHLT